MLTRLHIKDLAIVTTLDAEFQMGMTTLTGETGAGKSILIEALGLVLGDRAANTMIRTGCARAEITAVFETRHSPQAEEWLREHALDVGEACIVRRVLVRDGQSRAFINGSPVPLRSLQALGEQLVDIHGQHAHQSLLRPDQQRELLDEYAGNQKLRSSVATLYRRWRQVGQELEQVRRSAQERAERNDLLQFQIEELTRLGLRHGEAEEIDREQRRLSNAGQLRQQCATILTVLIDDEDSALTRLSLANRELDEVVTLDPALSECREMLESAGIQIEEAISSLRQYADGIELDPQQLDRVEQRLSEIHDLARKYRCRAEQLPDRLAALQEELEQMQHGDLQLAELEGRRRDLAESYLKQAGNLRKKRAAAAKRLEQSVSQGIRSLGMPEGRFRIELTKLPDEQTSPDGLDRIAFQVSANQGHPLQPLSRVASGGELSRISLAIQVATIRCAQIPTLIFDEVDVGIGGGVAEIIGRLLRQLGEERQVLCVTHLPQVASQGHHQLLISKRTDRQGVRTEIAQLDDQARIKEIARMLGGVEITANTLAHAREMINLSGG